MLPVAALILAALLVYLAARRPGVGLCLSLGVSIAFAAVCCHVQNVFGAVLAPVIFITTLIAIVLSRGCPDADDWPQTAARVVLGILVGTVLLVLIGGGFGIGGWFFGIMLAAMLIYCFLSARQATAHYVVSTLAASMRQNLPLVPALEAASAGRTDKRAVILRRIARWLEAGNSLGEAMRLGYRRCSGHTVATVLAAERVGQAPEALARLEAELSEKLHQRRGFKPVSAWYPLALICQMLAMVTFVMIFVIPKFSRIFADMGAELPVPTRHLFDIELWSEGAGLSTAVPSLAVTILLSWAFNSFFPRRPHRPRLHSQVCDWIKWHLPIAHWFEHNYSLLHAVEVLQMSLRAGCTVDRAVANTLELDVNCCFRRRLRRWLQRVESGKNVSSAARECGLGRTLAWAFDADVNAGNTPQILATVASILRANHNYRATLTRTAFWPLVVLAMAGMIGFVVYALFVPLVAMIECLSVLP